MKLFQVLALSLIGLLSACGGGGGGSPNAPDASFDAVVNLDAAAAEAMTTTVGVDNLQAVDRSGNTWRVNVHAAPAADVVYNGETLKSRVVTLQLFFNGSFFRNTVTQLAFRTAPFTPVATIDDFGFAVHSVNAAAGDRQLPTASTADDGYSFFRTQFFTDSTLSTPDGTTRTTWTLESRSASTGRFCLNTSGDRHLLTIASSECYILNENGFVQGLDFVKILVNGEVLTFN